MRDLFFFGGLVGILIIVWLIIGGPLGKSNETADASGSRFSFFNTDNSNSGDDNNTENTDTIGDELDDIEDDAEDLADEIEEARILSNSSVYKDVVTLRKERASSVDVDKEYVSIRVSRRAESSLPMTGWTLESAVTQRRIRIGNGVNYFRSGQVGLELPIVLNPGDVAYVLTGQSPLGVSFRTNLCTGYLEQFQDFSPRLPRECPLIEDHPSVDAGPHGFSDACLDHIERIGRCTIDRDPPLGLGDKCYNFLFQENNYNACVTDHKDEPGFYGDEWRIYLKREDVLWKSKREVIRLLDQTGKVIDTISY